MQLNTEDIRFLNAFEMLTHARAVDCFDAEGTLVFIIKSGQMGKAIGKGGETIAKVRRKLGKRVAVYEDSDNPREFIINACKPVRASPDIGDDYIKVDVPRGQRDQITGREIRILKELFKRKLGVNKADFSFV